MSGGIASLPPACLSDFIQIRLVGPVHPSRSLPLRKSPRQPEKRRISKREQEILAKLWDASGLNLWWSSISSRHHTL